jgi:hypothetical protein
MSNHRAVFRGADNGLVVAWEGAERECLAYQAGAHLHSVHLHVEVYGPECECGPEREPTTQKQRGFLARSGCLRCGNWDTKPTLDSR